VTDRLYLRPGAEILQGDIYEQMPSTHVQSRPLRVARCQQGPGGRDRWDVHLEDGTGPNGGFRWRTDQGGETGLLVGAYLGKAMVLSHDCEIENDTVRVLAMIRPATELNDATQQALFSGQPDGYYARFPLYQQTDDPIFERSFVDFRRLTTVRADVLTASTRVASLSEELRAALAESFRLYLFRRVERPTTGLR
jgi:hypothetical protein